MKKYFILTIFLLTVAMSITAQTNGREIMELLQEQDRGTTTHALVSMDLIDKRGNVSTRILELYSKENNEKKLNTMIVFTRQCLYNLPLKAST